MALVPSRLGKSGAQDERAQQLDVDGNIIQHTAKGLESITAAVDNLPLEALLRSRTVRAAGYGDQRFIPNTVLDDLITLEQVQRELDRIGARGLPLEALQVVSDRRKKDTLRRTFAILCLIQKSAEITAFIDEELSDKNLPYRFSDTSAEVFCSSKSDSAQPVRLFRTSRWRPAEREAFDAYQWQLLAPFFSHERDFQPHYKLSPEHILPFVKLGDVNKDKAHDVQNVHAGAFGQVEKIAIHPAHQKIDHEMVSGRHYVAIKSFGSGGGHRERHGSDFRREVEALKRFSGQNHIVSIIATYEYRRQMHIIFPWADGNLRDLWKRYPFPRSLFLRETMTWVSDQILGLAKALEHIHTGGMGIGRGSGSDYGRHGDLKPENILWFKSEGDSQLSGTLKIADFGATDIMKTGSGIKTRDVRAITETYKAPEFDTDDHIHQQYDVWSFGCLLLEFAVWSLQGWQGITEFADARVAESRDLIPSDAYYSLLVSPGEQKLSALIKPSVSRTIQNLQSDPLSSDYILGLLTIIENRLLLLRPEERAGISTVVEDLEALVPQDVTTVKCGPAQLGPSGADTYPSDSILELDSTDDSSSDSEYSTEHIALEELSVNVVEALNATLQEASDWSCDDDKIVHHLYSAKSHFSHWMSSLEWILMCQDSNLEEAGARVAVKRLFGNLERQEFFLSGIVHSHLRNMLGALDHMRKLNDNASTGSTYLAVLQTLQQDLSSAVECLGQQLIPIRAFVESSTHLQEQSDLTSQVQSKEYVTRDLEIVDSEVDDAQRAEEFRDTENIRLLLRSAEIQSAESESTFLPLSILEQTLSELRVNRELVNRGFLSTKALPDQDITAFTQLVRSQYLKVFAILVLMDEVDAISTFVKYQLNDSDLPLKLDLKSGQISRKETRNLPLDFLKDWKPLQHDTFIRYQRRVDIPYMAFDATTNVVRHVDFMAETILPFVELGDYHSRGDSYIRKVKIHPACHGFDGKVRNIRTFDDFALKCLIRKNNPHTETRFTMEVEMLRSLSRSHDHMVSLLMTWTHQDNYYLLFPLADGDLTDLWSVSHLRNPESDGSEYSSTVHWMSEQITGLIGAVHTIHQPQGFSSTRFGRHGDLKPENILWYRNGSIDRGTLVVSDFGSSTSNTLLSRSNIPFDKISMTPTYRPPEYDFGDRLGSRADDIWSLGCVFLELVCWGLGGGEMVKSFAQDRISPYGNAIVSDIFFEATVASDTRPMVRVKKQVSECIAKLHRHESCTKFHHDTLDIIENDMLVAISSERQRIISAQLVEKYGRVHSMVKEIDGYCTKPCPDTRAVQSQPSLETTLRPSLFSRLGMPLSVGTPLTEATAANLDAQHVARRSESGRINHKDGRPNETPLRPASALDGLSGAVSIHSSTTNSHSTYTSRLSQTWKRDRDRLQIQLQHATYHPQRLVMRHSSSHKHRSYDPGRIRHI